MGVDAWMACVTSEDLILEIHNFVSGATYGAKGRNEELARGAIVLLKTLPAAREAVLEHLCHVFDEAVSQHTREGEEAGGTAEESVIPDIHAVLSQFITSNPSSWAPLVSAWSLDLLGQLSSKYAGRRGVPHATSLTELLQLWMTCRATRTLIDLSTQSIATLISTDADLCVDALLDTSVQHSPNFDWVVAHIGSCFPNTIIRRVLVCGLKDFCCHDLEAPSMLLASEKKVPKLASVVGILGHLAGQHSEDIRRALVALFRNSFCENASAEQLATIPFLLQLASMSNMLLRVITTDFVTTLNADLLNQMCDQIPLWRTSIVPDLEGLASLVVHLVLRSDEGGAQVLQFLLTTAADDCQGEARILPKVRKACGLILDSLLLEMQRLVFTSRVADVPLLHCLQQDMPSLCYSLLGSVDTRVQWLLPILTAVGLQGGDRVGCCILKLLLTNAHKPRQLWNFVKILRSLEAVQPEVLVATVDQTISQLATFTASSTALVLSNLLTLLQWETGSKLPWRSSICRALKASLQVLANQLFGCNTEACDTTAELLALLPPSDALPSFVLAHLCRSVVRHFFKTIQCSRNKLQQVKLCKKIMAHLCQQSASRYYLLRLLIEGLTHNSYADKFGAKVPASRKRKWQESNGAFTLLQQNSEHAVTVTLPRSHSTVFHAGVIGQGPLAQPKETHTSTIEASANCQYLLDLLQTLCLSSPEPAASSLALLMVELISPDVMFNGLPWPEEDFMKVTVERDLHVKRCFDEFPVLWLLLTFLATMPPALCYCSVLLRALIAVMMSFWATCQEKKASNCPKQLELTCQVVTLMATGQLLPPPLCHTCELLPLLTPHEVSVILADIWQYMKENVPSPSLFNSNKLAKRSVERECHKKFTYRLQHILQKNIETSGKLYAKFFSLKPC